MKVNPESLKAIRTRSGFGVSKLAQAAQITPSYLSNLEAGRRTNASPEIVARIARALDVPVMAIISAYAPEQVA